MYIPNMYLLKAAFFLEGIQKSSLIIKKTPNKQSKTDMMKLSTDLVITASSLWTKY